MSTRPSSDPANDDKEPAVAWERQPGEGAKAFRAFCAYRDLGAGERSLSRVAVSLGYRSRSHLERWSSRFGWHERATAYDVYLDWEHRAEEQRSREALVRREMMLIQAIRSLAIRRIVGWDGAGDPSLAVAPLDPNDLSARDVAALLREAERMAGHRPEKRDWRREAVRRTQMVTPTEFIQATRDLAEIAMGYLPDEAKAAFAYEVKAWADGSWRPPR